MEYQSIDVQHYHTILESRPFITNSLTFFNKPNRIFLTIAEDPQVWQTDLCISEKMLAETIVCPYNSSMDIHKDAYDITKTVLKERMKYPNIKDAPHLEKIAKTWILPTKLHLGPDARQFLEGPPDSIIYTLLSPLFTTLSVEPTIHCLKVEVSGGQERHFLYKLLDTGIRPSLLLVKWSNDLDAHTLTAQCAGHILNTGYSLLNLNDSYALYMFTDQPLYDICSVKTVGFKNPFLEAILQSIPVSKVQPSTAQPTTAQPSTAQPTTAQPSTAQPTTSDSTAVTTVVSTTQDATM